MSQIAATHDEGGWAVFLDVDGTILEIAETPQAVYVPETLKLLLNGLRVRLDGALALVSGRSIADLDNLLQPFRFCAAGIHGCERREASGCVLHAEIDAASMDYARQRLTAVAREFPGLLLEDKGSAIAIHFRRALHLHAFVGATMTRMLEELGPQFTLQPGKCVFEIRPANCTKATAIHDFMQQPPFRGRTPLFIGDDVTDEDGFAYVNGCGGVSIRVGPPGTTSARYRLPNVAETIRWLHGIPPVITASLHETVTRDYVATGE